VAAWGSTPPARSPPAGATVVLADVDERALGAAADELRAQGHRVLGVACDVADEDQVAALVDRTVTEFGRLDIAWKRYADPTAATPSFSPFSPCSRLRRAGALTRTSSRPPPAETSTSPPSSTPSPAPARRTSPARTAPRS